MAQIEKINPNTGRLQVFTEYDYEASPSLTQQQWKDDCDINLIMKRYSQTGENPHKNLKMGAYADMSAMTDYQQMLDQVMFAQEAFKTLPAEARSRFQNDPAELITFMQDPNNYDEGVKLGLFNPKPPEPTQPNQQTQTPLQKLKTNKTKPGTEQLQDES